MLVFRRQRGESFVIGENVEVRVLHVGRSYVKIGVIAPPSVPVLRSEIARLNRQAVLEDWSSPRVASRLRGLLDALKGRRPAGAEGPKPAGPEGREPVGREDP
jgi:carbon storage regulator CsrA